MLRGASARANSDTIDFWLLGGMRFVTLEIPLGARGDWISTVTNSNAFSFQLYLWVKNNEAWKWNDVSKQMFQNVDPPTQTFLRCPQMIHHKSLSCKKMERWPID